MKKLIAVCLLALAALWTVGPSLAADADAKEAKVAHNVYFISTITRTRQRRSSLLPVRSIFPATPIPVSLRSASWRKT